MNKFDYNADGQTRKEQFINKTGAEIYRQFVGTITTSRAQEIAEALYKVNENLLISDEMAADYARLKRETEDQPLDDRKLLDVQGKLDYRDTSDLTDELAYE
jgi:hypothetical protein